MKKLLLWLLMVVLFVAVLLGGTVGAFYAMTDEGDLPAEEIAFGGVALQNAGYEWDVPVLGGVLYKHYYQPANLTVQRLGDLGDARPELTLPDWASQADLKLTAPDGTVAYQGAAADYADFVYTQNGAYTLELTLHQLDREKPAKPVGWYLYRASFTVQFEPQVTLSKSRAAQGDAVAVLVTGILDDAVPQAETELGRVWFRPVQGGWMGYIGVPYNCASGGVIRITCGETVVETELTVSASRYPTAPSTPSQPATAAANEEYRNAIWPLYESSAENKLWSGAFQAPSASAVAVEYGTIYMADGRRDGQATGLTYAAADGSDVTSPQAGVVDYAGTLQLTGGTVVIDHGCGVKSYLFGLGEVSAQRGQTVAAGDLLGKAGGGHDLIYEIRIGNKSIDPAPVLKGQSGLQYREGL